jgi:hypothetical protein
MHIWVETHGFECVFFLFVFSLIMSNAPKPPVHWGFWKLWAFGAMKALGASAAMVEQANPLAQQFLQTQTATPDKVVTETAASSGPVTDPK